MSILSRGEIKAHVARGELRIEPYEEKNVGAASVDLRLSRWFRRLVHDADDRRLQGPSREEELTRSEEPIEVLLLPAAPGVELGVEPLAAAELGRVERAAAADAPSRDHRVQELVVDDEDHEAAG